MFSSRVNRPGLESGEQGVKPKGIQKMQSQAKCPLNAIFLKLKNNIQNDNEQNIT